MLMDWFPGQALTLGFEIMVIDIPNFSIIGDSGADSVNSVRETAQLKCLRTGRLVLPYP